jgi:cytochrome c
MTGRVLVLWRHLVIVALAILSHAGYACAVGDATRGATVFQACMACHSTIPGAQMTGPSLASAWGRKAGTVAGFARYSDAMRRADVVWNDGTLDRWLSNPEAFIPGTSMTFPGLRENQARLDVIAYLHAVSEGAAPQAKERGGMMMNMQSPKEDLRKTPPDGQVASILHCRDTYTIKTADGKLNKVWEFNLRFKTDSSTFGPLAGKPVIVHAGMQGDRASVVFAAPAEISRFISEQCP